MLSKKFRNFKFKFCTLEKNGDTHSNDGGPYVRSHVGRLLLFCRDIRPADFGKVVGFWGAFSAVFAFSGFTGVVVTSGRDFSEVGFSVGVTVSKAFSGMDRGEDPYRSNPAAAISSAMAEGVSKYLALALA